MNNEAEKKPLEEKFTPQESDGLLQVFKLFDSNKNSVIDNEEFLKLKNYFARNKETPYIVLFL